jgi:hypothetical protein
MVTPSFVKIMRPPLARGCMTGEPVQRTDDDGMGYRGLARGVP